MARVYYIKRDWLAGGMLGNLLMLMEVLRWERSRDGLGDYLLKLDYQGWKKVGRRMSRESKKFRSGVKLSWRG